MEAIMSEETAVAPEESAETALAKFDVTEASIAKLRERMAMEPVKDKNEFTVLKANLAEVRGKRTDVEKRRKELKAPLLAEGKRIDDAAKQLTDKLRAIEDPLEAHKKDWEKREKKRKADEEERKRLRRIEIQNLLQKIRDQVNDPYAEIPELERRLQVLEDTNEPTKTLFDEHVTEAKALLAECRAKAKKLLDDARARAEEDARREEERKQLEEQRKALAEKEAKIEAEKAKIEQEQEPHANVPAEAVHAPMAEIRQNPTLDGAVQIGPGDGTSVHQHGVVGRIEPAVDPTAVPDEDVDYKAMAKECLEDYAALIAAGVIDNANRYDPADIRLCAEAIAR